MSLSDTVTSMHAPAPRTAADLRALLRLRLDPREWALMFEVRNGTGFERAPRTADAVAMGLWPMTTGLEVHGFELKVSRGDWLRELKQPEKSEELARFCDRWWMVVGDAAIAKPTELPPGWGLLVPRNGRLHAARSAPKLEGREQPDRLFIASMLRAATRSP
jgi:hypothetical protein